MSARRFSFFSWSLWLLLFLDLGFSPAESADLISRCPAQVPRTQFLKAANWGKCYEFHSQERTWKDANNICAKKGGHLVTIREERIQLFLLKALSDLRWPRNGLWIGATDKENEMDWVWVTGQKVKNGYNKWASGQPSCGQLLCFEDCAVMRWKESGRWHDYACSWFENYSFICEYDMLPEPTTTVKPTTPTVPSSASTSTSTSSTAAQTAVETVPVNKTSVAVSSTVKVLDSEYLVHGHRGTEEKGKNVTQKEPDNPEIVFQPTEVVHGVDGARAEQVQERVSTSSSTMNSGTVAVVVITVLTSLAAGLCIFLIMRRRRRKQIREDDGGIGYENPYYEETKACLSGKGTGSRVDDSDGEAEEHNADGGSVAVHSSKVRSAVGFKAPTASRNDKETNLLPVPPQAPQRCVMNNYDTPPAASTRMPHTNKKDSDKDHYASGNGQPIAAGYDQPRSLAVSKETENCYDEIHSQRPDSKYAYDVPRASRQQFYRSGFAETDDSLPQLEHTYGNSYEENIYESVDNLRAIINQEETPATLVVENIKDGDDDEDRYVPFMFDTPKESP